MKNEHYLGHRSRLKDKFFLTEDLTAFADYELLELLLFFSVPRRDVKPLAKDLLKKFGSLYKVLHAEQDEFSTIKGINRGSLIHFKVIREFFSRIFRKNIINKHVLSSWGDLLKYLKYSMSALPIEYLRVIFLNNQKLILGDETLSKGTVSHATIYPREIIKRALSLGATSIILVHNHPGGTVKPSKEDLVMTAKIQESCQACSLLLHDHIIISDQKHYSFKENHLIE